MPDIAVARPKSHSFNPINQRKAAAKTAQEKKQLENLKHIGKQWEASQKNPEYTSGKAPTTAGIANAARLQHARRMSSLRAGDSTYADPTMDPSSPEYYNNQMNGMSPPMQDIQIKPLEPKQEMYVNRYNKLRIKHLAHDIFADGNPSDPSKEAKILELAPFLNPTARTKLGNIAGGEPILGHGGKTWSELNPNEKQGLINDIKAGQMTHSEALLQQQTHASIEDQQTAFFTNRLMSHNNMIAIFMTELAQLAKKWADMVRSSV